ncbi:MAG: hypothetical protein KJO39_06565 [Bacteroidia bacterium]|nr:hypothetical protein [Bacteroidia bacterium]NNF31098.1 hypothetical protein [Flavobacteriaceae bacterium]NNJ81035.1 hypothetical protein [Flavobacteriaceae bacterium]NNK55560.1 hypothetical protein [Flavobacteriaceae bacterium]NNM08850.1 hypothetical protein [Flavobacteriaceae bacterium]
MKKIARLPLLFLFVFGMIFTSCQKEEEIFIDQNGEETITANSILTRLLIRTSQNAGDLDDIIDGNSCVSVKFPITVIANGQEVILMDEDDIDLIEAIFDQFPNDTDTLEIVFPITVILDDYTEVVVNSQAELDALIAACESSGGDDSISCLDFEYPITFFIFDNNQQQTGTVTVNSDLELYIFLNGIGDDDYFSIDYPINVILEDGSVVTVNNNAELEQLIEDCENNTGGGDPIDPVIFEQNLTTGVWYITYFFDDFDETANYDGYEFTFATDNTAQATNGTNTVPGTWMFEGGSSPDLTLFFGTTDPFDELDDDWDILEATNEIIRLRDESGDGSVDYLTFERNPATGGGGGTNDLIDQLTDGIWYVTLLNDDGDIETCDYVDYVFTYNLNGTATAVSATTTVTGFWSVELDDGMLDLILNFDITADPNFDDINDDWDVTDFNANLISLIDVSGGGGGTDILEFGRAQATGCGGGGSGQALVDALEDGQWFVSEYLDDGIDETMDYNGYTLTFSTGTVVATNGSNTFNGTWAVTDTGGDLDLTLDFGTQIPFDEFNDDWDVLNFTNSIVELEDVSGGGGGTDNLTFQKL